MAKPSWLQRLQERRQEKRSDKAYRSAMADELTMHIYAGNRWAIPPEARDKVLEKAFLAKHGLLDRAKPDERERGRGSKGNDHRRGR